MLVPQTFTVTNTNDTGTGANGVGTGTSGDLRYCITQANLDTAVGAADIITFSNSSAGGQTNFYDGSVHTITLNSALPWLSDPMTINGPTLIGGATVFPGGGTPAVTIARSATAPAMRIFNTNTNFLTVAGSANVVTMSNLTLSGASTTTLAGGAINVAFANLSLSNMLIQNNLGSNGGGIADSAQAPGTTGGNYTSTLTISNSTIQANTGAAGGGIYDLSRLDAHGHERRHPEQQGILDRRRDFSKRYQLWDV